MPDAGAYGKRLAPRVTHVLVPSLSVIRVLMGNISYWMLIDKTFVLGFATQTPRSGARRS